jgi:ribonuclease P protein component
MISKPHRFHGYGSLRYVYNNGKTVRGPLCSLKYTLNERRKTYRLAVVVSKKVSKSAVIRNRIRRRVYETVRLLEYKIDAPYDLVLTVFSENVATLGEAELSRAIRAQFKQAGVI